MPNHTVRLYLDPDLDDLDPASEAIGAEQSLDLSHHQRMVLERLANADDPQLSMRAQLILDWADGLSGFASSELRGASRRTVSKWRCRFRVGGIEALSDRPRTGAPPSFPSNMADELERLRQTPPPPGEPRWTTRLLAKRMGISQSSVVRLDRRREREQTRQQMDLSPQVPSSQTATLLDVRKYVADSLTN